MVTIFSKVESSSIWVLNFEILINEVISNEITLDSLTQENYNIIGTKVASLNITITAYQIRIVIKDITILPNK